MVSPGWPGSRWDPPEGPEVQSVQGTCDHADTIWEEMTPDFYEAVVHACVEMEETAYDDEMDSRYEREQDRMMFDQ